MMLGATIAGAGCGSGDAACKLEDPVASCKDGLVCEMAGDKPACVAPLVLRGHVHDPSGAPIAGARVAGLDANDAPATGTAITDAAGAFELRVSAGRSDANGAVVATKLKLRASASGYDPFPLGIRLSLPIELSTATKKDNKLVIESAQTDIVLFPITGAAALGSIAGTVKAGAGKSGALIVAEGPATLTTVSDLDGEYVLYNALPGTYTVRGYAAGLQLVPAMNVVVAPSARTEPVDLALGTAPLATVSGAVNLVDRGTGAGTSVVLVVEATFNETLKRGEVPPGLRAPKSGPPSLTGAFTIDGVPDGKYVVLAAFENDGLVRDPDISIAGTQIQKITVGGAPVTLAKEFKITGALAVISPGAGDVPDEVSGTPVFKWKDDSSEEYYTIQVYDTKGVLKWEDNNVMRVMGGDVSVTYGGLPLTPGEYYQFRASSMKVGRNGPTPISMTEDLRGIFVYR
jgi:hypothetical protein